MSKQDEIDFIKQWYSFRETMCAKYNNYCKDCPLYESSDGWRGENGYEWVDNCKYDFDDIYAEDIIDLLNKN